jgi:hypothetical protein
LQPFEKAAHTRRYRRNRYRISVADCFLGCLAGIALIGLGVACWPGPPLIGMLTYSVLAMLYLTYIGVCGQWIGPLPWPAVVLHAVLTFLLARTWFKPQQN